MTIYECDYSPSETNGHWHLTIQDADRCKERWANWNNIIPRELIKSKYGSSNKPHGTPSRDGFNYGIGVPQ